MKNIVFNAQTEELTIIEVQDETSIDPKEQPKSEIETIQNDIDDIYAQFLKSQGVDINV